MISSWLGSWTGIAAVWIVCSIWMAAMWPIIGLQPATNILTFFLSIVSLTFTQLVLREQAAETEHQKRMLKEVVHATDGADDGVCQDDQQA